MCNLNFPYIGRKEINIPSLRTPIMPNLFLSKWSDQFKCNNNLLISYSLTPKILRSPNIQTWRTQTSQHSISQDPAAKSDDTRTRTELDAPCTKAKPYDTRTRT